MGRRRLYPIDPRTGTTDAARQAACRQRQRQAACAQRQAWATPPDLFAQLDAEFRFTLDVAAQPDNALCVRFYTPEQDGLSQSWAGDGGVSASSQHGYAVVAHMGHTVGRDPVAARAAQVQWEQDQCAVPMRGRDFSACGRDPQRGRCAGGPRLSLTTFPQHRDSSFRACAEGRGLVPPAERDTPGSLGASMRSSTSDILAGTADLLVMAQADFRGQAGVRPAAGAGGGRAALAVGLQCGSLCAVSPPPVADAVAAWQGEA
jgi:hypothetical protein